MGKFKDLTGETFGRLTVISRAPNSEDGRVMWNCRCSCENGTIITVRGDSLKGGKTQSCGCLDKETSREQGYKNRTHGKSKDKIYRVWRAIINRCTNPNDKSYKNYGGRGIRVCERWLEFENFYEDVSKLEHFGEKGYTLDRIDNNGNYEPSNIRWADKKTQQRNKTNNRLVEYQDKQIPVAEAAELSGINKRTLLWRLNHGRQGEDLFKPPAGR